MLFHTLYETNVYYFPFTKNLEGKKTACAFSESWERCLGKSSIRKHQMLSMQIQTLTNKHIRNSYLRMF